jgi:hypothetical protein
MRSAERGVYQPRFDQPVRKLFDTIRKLDRRFSERPYGVELVTRHPACGKTDEKKDGRNF